MSGSSAASAASRACIKGLAFREFIGWYEITRGREATLRAYESLAAEHRALLDPDRDCFGLLAGSWYPVELATGLLEAVTWGLGPEDRTALLHGGVEHTLRVTITGVYRVLFNTLMTPERHAKYAQKIWSNFFNSGTVTGRVLAPGRAEQIIRAWSGHHPLLCELSIWSATVFHEAMGCNNVRVSRSSCVLDASVRPRRFPSSEKMRAVRPASSPPAPAPADEDAPGCRFLIQWDGGA